MSRAARTLSALLLAICALVAGAVIARLGDHERLRLQNTFKTPEEVVRYYVARDASGFVWSGLLDRERTEFTLWETSPETESFYVATEYEIVPNTRQPASAEFAQVEVRYKLLGVSDAFGTMTPVLEKDHRVLFNLKWVQGRWKIASPQPPQVAPVVLRKKFPLATASR